MISYDMHIIVSICHIESMSPKLKNKFQSSEYHIIDNNMSIQISYMV